MLGETMLFGKIGDPGPVADAGSDFTRQCILGHGLFEFRCDKYVRENSNDEDTPNKGHMMLSVCS
jgi:hypothetical protein